MSNMSVLSKVTPKSLTLFDRGTGALVKICVGAETPTSLTQIGDESMMRLFIF